MAKVTRRRRKIGVDAAGRPVYRDEGWRARYVDPDGRERSSKAFRLKSEAEDFALEQEHRKRTGSYVDPRLGRVTFEAYAEEWRAARPHRASTRESLESTLRGHVYPAIGHRPLAAIRPTELQALITDRATVIPGSIERMSTWVRTIFRAAVEDRIITVSPAARLSVPDRGAHEPVQPFELDQVDALAGALPGRLRAMVALGVGAGLRAGEGLGVTVDRIDFLRRELVVDRQLLTVTGRPPHFGPPKTKASRRTIPLPDTVLDELARHLAEFRAGADGLLFTNERGLTAGQGIRRNTWCEHWCRAVVAAGLAKGERFHRLRHTYASLLIREGCSVKVVQARLGHATAQETLDTYAHLWPDDDDRTRAAIDRALRGRSDHDRTIGVSEG